MPSNMPSINKNHQESTVTQKINFGIVSLTEWISSILIERHLFQNTGIPPETLLYLINDVILTLSPEKAETIDMAQELTILGKKILGKALTPEETRYNNIPNKVIDPTKEIMNGLRYSSMALLGKQLYTSLSTAFTKGLWQHFPAIIGYTTAITLGPKAIGHAVNEALRFATNLTDEQKALIKPWLTMFGRLALRLIPKVHATEAGVHYHYPATEGHTQTFSLGQSVTLKGNAVIVEHAGSLETPEGIFDASYQFQLHRVTRISEESIHLQVLNENREKIPLRFTLIQGQFGPEITAHWSRYFKRPMTQNTFTTQPLLPDTVSYAGQMVRPTSHTTVDERSMSASLQSVMEFSSIISAYAVGGTSAAMTMLFLTVSSKVPGGAASPLSQNIRKNFYKDYFQKTILLAGLQAQLSSLQDVNNQDNYFDDVIYSFRSMYDPVAAISNLYGDLATAEAARLTEEAQGWGDDCRFK